MTFIKEYITKLKESLPSKDIAKRLGISPPMISSYLGGSYNPSLNVAKRVYELDGTVLHPFSGESLELELDKDNSWKN